MNAYKIKWRQNSSHIFTAITYTRHVSPHCPSNIVCHGLMMENSPVLVCPSRCWSTWPSRRTRLASSAGPAWRVRPGADRDGRVRVGRLCRPRATKSGGTRTCTACCPRARCPAALPACPRTWGLRTIPVSSGTSACSGVEERRTEIMKPIGEQCSRCLIFRFLMRPYHKEDKHL